MIWKFRDRGLDLSEAKLMGVINITPDSFSDGNQCFAPEQALKHAECLIAEGADLLDLGAESTRPGADLISPKEQLLRLLPSLKSIRAFSDIPISIDTTSSEVAEVCLKEGADIINDVSGFKDDPRLAEVAVRFNAGCVLMHRRGDAQTMQSLAEYNRVTEEVMSECQASIEIALKSGIAKECIVLDPGLGFAKKFEHNMTLMAELDCFVCSGYPVLLGPSRKSFIGEITGKPVGDREFGTAACVSWGLERGVKIFRVHNVRAMKDVVKVHESLSAITDAVRSGTG